MTALTLKRFGHILLGDTPEGLAFINNNDTSFSALRTAFIQNFEKGHDCYLQGGVNMYDFSKETFREMFRPSTEVNDRVQNICQVLGEERYGIHIRRTDNVKSIRNSPDELFEKAIRNIIAVSPDAKFYLATDSQQVKLHFKAIFGDRLVTGASAANRNTRQGIIDAATEMFTLASTKRIIGSYWSSFSEIAALLGDTPIQLATLFK